MFEIKQEVSRKAHTSIHINLVVFSQEHVNLTMIPEKINSSTRTRLRYPILQRKDFSKCKAENEIKKSSLIFSFYSCTRMGLCDIRNAKQEKV